MSMFMLLFYKFYQVATESLIREASLTWKGREGNSGEVMFKQKDG